MDEKARKLSECFYGVNGVGINPPTRRMVINYRTRLFLSRPICRIGGVLVVAFIGGALIARARAPKLPPGYEPTGVVGLGVRARTVTLPNIGPFDPVNVAFHLVNTSHSALVIEQVRASCGCITVSWKEKTMKPGESVAIRATLDPRKLSGLNFTKDVLVSISRGDTREASQFPLRITGTVDRSAELSVWPSIIAIGSVRPGDQIVRKVFLRGDKAFLAALPERVDFHARRLEWRVPDTPPQHELSYREIDLAFRIESTQPHGPLQEEMAIVVDGAPERRVSVKLKGEVSPSGLSVTPPVVYLGINSQGVAPEVEVELRSSNQRSLDIQSITSDLQVSCHVNATGSNTSRILTIKPDLNESLTHPSLGSIWIDTNLGKEVIKVFLLPVGQTERSR